MTEQEKWEQRIQEGNERFMQAWRELVADVQAFEAKAFTPTAPTDGVIWSTKEVNLFINNNGGTAGDHIGNFNKGRYTP